MNIWFIFFIIFLSLTDLTITIFVIRYFKNEIPERKDWWMLESNPIARFIWKGFGFRRGNIILYFYALAYSMLVGWIFSHDRFLMGFLSGGYMVVFSQHLRVLIDIRAIVRRRKELLLHKDNNRKV
jgi:hypothetical protein